ncbi:olfactory receptor 1030-like [Onychomys torridus]|uniref:olfactory receptor 1030-like n=1 Tax=Onychomys torridus TaxID=38674 RepID=UPI00167FA2D2|nr:olfactory receptor 1030-like [Onychomys torridus]
MASLLVFPMSNLDFCSSNVAPVIEYQKEIKAESGLKCNLAFITLYTNWTIDFEKKINPNILNTEQAFHKLELSQLHTPMYFFLSHLSFVDLCYATNVTPQMLVNFLSKRKNISFIGCFIQFHFFIALVITDYYMLTVMAYDRYMAICKPLLYTSKMSRGVCLSLVTATYIYGFANGLAQTILMLRLTFCGPNEINHFYCADPPLMVLACSDTYVKETAIFVVAGSNLTCSLTIILISYIFIFTAILQIRSAEGRRKAFSTCGSHLVAVTVFYGTLFCMYLRPPSEKSVEQGKIVAVFYIFVSPMLNPLIYSLRNKDVKKAIRKVVHKEVFMK